MQRFNFSFLPFRFFAIFKHDKLVNWLSKRSGTEVDLRWFDEDFCPVLTHFYMVEFQLNHTWVCNNTIWAPSSEFVSSSILSWQILTVHAQPFRGARDLAFCQKVSLDSLLVWASSEGSGETARMRRLVWTLAARIGDKYQIRLTRSI